MTFRKAIAFSAVSCASLVFATAAMADHSWGRYKWGPSSIPFSLQLGDNVSPDWDTYLTEASIGWSVSRSLSTTVIAGSTTGTGCSPEAGNVQVCSDDYGKTGWLGLAQIYTRGNTIIAGRAKLNDYYHSAAPYNTTAWRRLVMCQEVAHTFGLGHQDETFANANLGTCMDYTDDPDGTLHNGGVSNEYPNQHDYDQLELLYPLATTADDGGSSGGGSSCNPKSPKCKANAAVGDHPEWGRLVSGHGGIEVFERVLAGGMRVLTTVTWTLENADSHPH